MNTLIATVTKIDTIDNLNIVKFDFSGQTLSMMSLDLSDDIKIGTNVKLITKPTYIAIAKEFSGMLSYSNQLKAKIKELENGKLLSSVKLEIEEFVLESIITFESSKKMDLKVGDEVTAFIKASELSILKVL
ncbi:TOBE domain-containing protein [Sulfurovum sp. CS9]|uniref:TOBE domain-containing protein n=1 Tax=Sulfurovum sp. CS9 TaxID=3391146 RepID=UPI0039EC1080